MSSELIWLVPLSLFAGIWTALIWVLLNRQSKVRVFEAEARRDTRLSEIKIMDKLVAILAVKDPLSYQQIQAMDMAPQYTDYDPSDEAEIRRIHERLGDLDDTEDMMTDAERDFLDDLHPGSGFTGTSVQ